MPTLTYGITKQEIINEDNTITYVENGTIQGTNPQTVEIGLNGTAITVIPNDGYLFVNWSDGVTTETRTDTNIQGDIIVTANLANIEEYEANIRAQDDCMEAIFYSQDALRNVTHMCVYSLSLNKNVTTIFSYTEIMEDGILIGRTLNGSIRKELPIPEIIALNKLNITDTQPVVRG